MEFRILGPLQAIDGETEIPLGPGKQRALLAVLLLNANRIVPLQRIIEELWDVAPDTAPKAIQTHVSRLRKVLPEGVLKTRSPGYVLELDADQLDLERFEKLRDEGRVALAGDDPESAAAHLAEALRLWRGPALAEFASEPLRRSEGARLEELHLATLEEEIEANLALGRHAELVGELEGLVARHPLRERLRGQLMLALYRSGRQAEALAAYQDARRTLVGELGLEPGRALQDLERAILRHDSALDVSPERAGPSKTTSTELQTEDVARVWGADAGPFVGREPELELLRDLLAQAFGGSGRLVLLTGEPGVGKTRTAAELARLASGLGARVLWGRCYEREGAPPYWPWLQAIRPYVATCPRDRLKRELGPSAGVIADVLPEVRERLADVEAPRGLPDERQARFRLLDAIASFLRRAAQHEPFVLVLEDLHAADAASLALLDFVARELESARLLVVGTYRDVEIGRGHPLRQALAELARDHLYERLALSGLAPEEVSSFIAASLGEEPPPSLVTEVYDRTAGNPLFMTEVVRILGHEGRRDWVGVPEGVREVIGIRLDRLPPECNEVLRVAAVVGREFGLDQLGPLVDGASDDDLLALVENALAAGIVHEATGSPGRFRFAHPLIRETLEAELSSARRVRLHGRIATTLEQLYGASASEHAAELAYHFAEAETVIDPERVVHYCRLAGDQAYGAHAYDDAIACFQRALAAREGSAMDDETASLVFALVRSEFLGRDRLDLEGAVERMRGAFDYYIESGSTQLAIDIAAHPIPPVWGPTEVPTLLARALELADPTSLEAGHILANIGRFAGTNNGDFEAARDAFDRSLEIARRHGDQSLERRALTLAARVDWWFMHWEECTEKSRLALELALAAGDQQTEMYARAWLARDAAIRGDLEAARTEGGCSLELAERLRERYWLATARLNSFWLAALAGDWKTARSFSDGGLAAQPHDSRNLAVRALLEYELGATEAGDAHVDRLLEAMRAVSSDSTVEHSAAAAALALASRLTGRQEMLPESAAASERALGAPIRIPIFDLQARIGLAMLAVQRSDAESAAAQYEALEPHRGSLLLTFCLSADRLLGLLALTAGRLDEACDLFESSLSFCEGAGYVPELARTAVDYAGALRRRDGPGDADRAGGLLADALETSRALGMRRLEERILAAGLP
jgi:DNA-binding SARP family transcriptional activator